MGDQCLGRHQSNIISSQMAGIEKAESNATDLFHSHGKMDNEKVVGDQHVEGKYEAMFLKDFEEMCLKEKTSVQDVKEDEDWEEEQKTEFLKQRHEYYFLKIKERILDESITNLQRKYAEILENGQNCSETLADWQ